MRISAFNRAAFTAFSFTSGHHIPTGRQAFTNIIGFLVAVVLILGIVLFLVGLVKLMIAHAEEDGTAYQKAVMCIAGGITLILIELILSYFDVDTKLLNLPNITSISCALPAEATAAMRRISGMLPLRA